jgi:hypothetical protein
MRYRIGNTPDELGEPIGQGTIVAAAAFSFVLGIGFVITGLRSRHYWLTLWGAGLSLASAAYLAFTLFGR